MELPPAELKEAILKILELTVELPELTSERLAAASTLTRREADFLLKQLSLEGLSIEANGRFLFHFEQRLKLALQAVRLGASPERASRNLSWREFEDFVRQVFESNGYKVSLHVRIKVEETFSEIDLLSLKGETLILADCKRWRRPLHLSGAKQAVQRQLLRLKALGNLENLEVLRKKMGELLPRKIYAIPVVITLFEFPQKFVEKVPIVPIFKLSNFLYELPSHLHMLPIKEINI